MEPAHVFPTAAFCPGSHRGPSSSPSVLLEQQPQNHEPNELSPSELIQSQVL